MFFVPRKAGHDGKPRLETASRLLVLLIVGACSQSNTAPSTASGGAGSNAGEAGSGGSGGGGASGGNAAGGSTGGNDAGGASGAIGGSAGPPLDSEGHAGGGATFERRRPEELGGP